MRWIGIRFGFVAHHEVRSGGRVLALGSLTF